MPDDKITIHLALTDVPVLRRLLADAERELERAEHDAETRFGNDSWACEHYAEELARCRELQRFFASLPKE